MGGLSILIVEPDAERGLALMEAIEKDRHEALFVGDVMRALGCARKFTFDGGLLSGEARALAGRLAFPTVTFEPTVPLGEVVRRLRWRLAGAYSGRELGRR